MLAAFAFIIPHDPEPTYTRRTLAFARDLGRDSPPFALDENRRAQLRDELRYVLDPKDVMGADYPSETFRVLQNNEMKRFGEYRTRRLILAAYDAQVAAGARPRVEGYR